jgi:hypothetical protein
MASMGDATLAEGRLLRGYEADFDRWHQFKQNPA